MGAVSREMEKNKTSVRRSRIHRDQAIMERFNRTLAERLFGHQYAVEMRLTDDQRSTEWIKRLAAVVSALNDEVTHLIGRKPAETIKRRPSLPNPRHLTQGLFG